MFRAKHLLPKSKNDAFRQHFPNVTFKTILAKSHWTLCLFAEVATLSPFPNPLPPVQC